MCANARRGIECVCVSMHAHSEEDAWDAREICIVKTSNQMRRRHLWQMAIALNEREKNILIDT